LKLWGFHGELPPYEAKQDEKQRKQKENKSRKKEHKDFQRIQEADREHGRDKPADAADDDARRAALKRPADEPVKPHQEEDDCQQDVATRHVAEEPQRQ